MITKDKDKGKKGGIMLTRKELEKQIKDYDKKIKKHEEAIGYLKASKNIALAMINAIDTKITQKG